MKIKSVVLMLALVGFFGVGCAMVSAPVVPPMGGIYSDVKAPIDIDVDKTSFGSKRGESSVVAILLLVSTGDGSIQAAAKNGGITTVNHVDYEFTSVLGVYQKYTTIVYGD